MDPITDLHKAQDRLFGILAALPAPEALALAATQAEQARAAATSFAGEREAAAAAKEARIAARRHSTGGDWRAAVRSCLVHAQLAHAVAPAYLLHAAPAALPVCRRQLAAAGDPEEIEREQLADDLARIGGVHAAAVQREQCEADGCTCVHCEPRARADAERDFYAFALGLPLNELRRRHASELAERSAL